MDTLSEEVIRGFGWGLLKVISLGRYRSSRANARLSEGATGLLAVAAISWTIYLWWPST